MSLRETMKPSNTVYLYDGTLEGFFSAVFEAVYARQIPVDITPPSGERTLFESKEIVTDRDKAGRVSVSVTDKISARAMELIENVFCSCLHQKEIRLFRFLLLGYDVGEKAEDMMGNDDVSALLAAEQHLLHEQHLLSGFIRFSDYDGMLAAVITPKNFVLPYLAPHFAARYNAERFMIYDKTHRCALIYEDRKIQLVRMESIALPEASENEQTYRELWKQFYRSISIEARENPRCRMTHMPKRFWENMTEMRGCL